MQLKIKKTLLELEKESFLNWHDSTKYSRETDTVLWYFNSVSTRGKAYSEKRGLDIYYIIILDNEVYRPEDLLELFFSKNGDERKPKKRRKNGTAQKNDSAN